MRTWGLALAAPVVLALVVFLACNGGGGSTGDDGSCARICAQMATCEGGVHWSDCPNECKAIENDIDPAYWSGVAGCLTCNTGDSYQCLQGVAQGVPMSTVQGFLQQLCQWEAMCQPGLTVDQCVGALEDAGTSGGTDLWNLLGLLSSGARQCLVSCIQHQSCTSAESAAASCLQSCNLTGVFDNGGSSSCSCGCTGCCSGHGKFSCDNPSCTETCTCDPGYYATGNLECAPTCQITGCGAHGTCGGNTCTCDKGYAVGMDGHCYYVAKFTSLAVGEEAACATRDDGRVECFVADNTDEASKVPTDTSYTRVCVDTGTIPAFGCGTKPDGSVTCWGQVVESTFPAGTKAVGCAEGFYCVSDATGAAQCYDFKGSLTGKQPPSGLVQLAVYSVDVNGNITGCGRDASGGVHCFGPPYERDAGTVVLPANVASGTKDLAVTDEGGCAVTSTGGLSCWGYPTKVIPANLATIDRVVIGWMLTCVRKTDRTVQCWDDSGNDATPAVFMGRTVVDLGATYQDLNTNVCVLYDAGTLQCSSQFFSPIYQREVSPTLF